MSASRSREFKRNCRNVSSWDVVRSGSPHAVFFFLACMVLFKMSGIYHRHPLLCLMQPEPPSFDKWPFYWNSQYCSCLLRVFVIFNCVMDHKSWEPTVWRAHYWHQWLSFRRNLKCLSSWMWKRTGENPIRGEEKNEENWFSDLHIRYVSCLMAESKTKSSLNVKKKSFKNLIWKPKYSQGLRDYTK